MTSIPEIRDHLADRPDVPPVVAAWVTQLLAPDFLALMRSWPAERVDVTVSASRGRVRRLPEIAFNGGQMEHVEP